MTSLTPHEAAANLLAEIRALPSGYTPVVRDLRRARTWAWRAEPATFILDIAMEARVWDRRRWVGYELVRFHRGAFASLNNAWIARLAEGLDSWDSVDGRAGSSPAQPGRRA